MRREDTMTIPKEITDKHHNITLCMDVMTVNEIEFLASINKILRVLQYHLRD